MAFSGNLSFFSSSKGFLDVALLAWSLCFSIRSFSTGGGIFAVYPIATLMICLRLWADGVILSSWSPEWPICLGKRGFECATYCYCGKSSYSLKVRGSSEIVEMNCFEVLTSDWAWLWGARLYEVCWGKLRGIPKTCNPLDLIWFRDWFAYGVGLTAVFALVCLLERGNLVNVVLWF